MTFAARQQAHALRQALKLGETTTLRRRSHADAPLEDMPVIVDRGSAQPSAGDRRHTAQRRFSVFIPALALTDNLGQPSPGDTLVLKVDPSQPDTIAAAPMPIAALLVADVDGYTVEVTAPAPQ